MTMITPSYLGETIEYSSLHACRSTLEDPTNSPVADFHCVQCREQFELKSQRGRFGPKVADGAFGAKMQRLASDDSPNLMLMNYDLARFAVTDLFFSAQAVLHGGDHRGAAAVGGDGPARGLGRLEDRDPRRAGERQGLVREGRRAAGAGGGACAVALDAFSAGRRRPGAGVADRGDEVRRGAPPPSARFAVRHLPRALRRGGGVAARASPWPTPTPTPSRPGSLRSTPATTTCGRRYASNCRCCATAAGSSSWGAGGIGCGRRPSEHAPLPARPSASRDPGRKGGSTKNTKSTNTGGPPAMAVTIRQPVRAFRVFRVRTFRRRRAPAWVPACAGMSGVGAG